MVLNMFFQLIWNEFFFMDISLQLRLGMMRMGWRTFNSIIGNIFKSCYPGNIARDKITLSSLESKISYMYSMIITSTTPEFENIENSI